MQIDPQIPPDLDFSSWLAFVKSLMKAIVLVLVAGVWGILWHLSDASKERTWKDKLTVLIIAGCAGAMAGPCAMSLIAFAYKLKTGDTLPPDVQLAVGCVGAGLGAKMLDMINTRMAHLSKVNLKDPGDIGKCREGMTPEERARHADSCVFTPDRCGGKCMRCPHRNREE